MPYERGFTIRGMEPEDHIYDFQITIDADFADVLRELDVPDEQEAVREHIKEGLTHDIGDIRFVGDSFLLHGITVGIQATGLDLHKEEFGRQTYATHNVDSPGEAAQVISAFGEWEEFANRLAEDHLEETAGPKCENQMCGREAVVEFGDWPKKRARRFCRPCYNAWDRGVRSHYHQGVPEPSQIEAGGEQGG